MGSHRSGCSQEWVLTGVDAGRTGYSTFSRIFQIISVFLKSRCFLPFDMPRPRQLQLPCSVLRGFFHLLLFSLTTPCWPNSWGFPTSPLLVTWGLSISHVTSDNRSEKPSWGFPETFSFIDKDSNLVQSELCSWSLLPPLWNELMMCCKCQLLPWDHEAINPNRKCQHVTGVKFLGHTRRVKAWKYALGFQVLC